MTPLALRLTRLLTVLQQIHPRARLLLVGQAPEPGFNTEACTVRKLMFGRDVRRCGLGVRGAADRLRFGDALITRLAAAGPNVSALLTDRLMCSGGRCPTMRDGVPLYRDHNHLSVPGALLVLTDCLDAFVGAAAGGSHRARQPCPADALVD